MFRCFIFDTDSSKKNELARVGATLYLRSLWLYEYILIWTDNLGNTECTCTEPVWYMYGTPTDHHWIRIWRFDHFLTTNYNFFLPIIHLPLSDLVYERFYTNISILLLVSVRELFPRVSACFMQCSQHIWIGKNSVVLCFPS